MHCELLIRWSMALAVYKIHGHSAGNNVPPVAAKEDETKAVLAFNVTAKGIIHTVRAVHYW